MGWKKAVNDKELMELYKNYEMDKDKFIYETSKKVSIWSLRLLILKKFKSTDRELALKNEEITKVKQQLTSKE